MPKMQNGMVLISTIEQFKECKGYAINPDGIVYSCKAANWTRYYYGSFWLPMSQKISKSGYPFVIMSNFGKDVTARVHTLVTLAFIPKPDHNCEVNHIDGNKLNNSVSNLEWCSHRDNMIHCIENNLRNTACGEDMPNSVLKEADIYRIFELREKGLTHREIAKIYSIDSASITRILTGKAWKHITASLLPNATDACSRNHNDEQKNSS